MKYLSNYTEEAQSKLYDDCGAFFAFSREQFEDGKKKVGASSENKLVDVGAGCYVLSKNYEKFVDGLENINKKGIEADIKENGIENIIQRELGNYETQITGNWREALEALDGYDGVTEQLVKEQYKIYFQKCIDNDWF